MKGMPWKDQAGLTLIEILVAVALIMIGLVAVMQWFPLGTQGMDTGRKQSTAVFLGEQKIEQIKAWSLSAAAGQGFTTVTMAGTCRTAGPCADDNLNFNGVNIIAGYPEYSRTVIICTATSLNPPCPPPLPTATTALVRVQVGYQRVTQGGVFASANQVELATLIAQH